MTTTTTTKSKVSVTISENGPYIVTDDIPPRQIKLLLMQHPFSH